VYIILVGAAHTVCLSLASLLQSEQNQYRTTIIEKPSHIEYYLAFSYVCALQPSLPLFFGCQQSVSKECGRAYQQIIYVNSLMIMKQKLLLFILIRKGKIKN
jgi:hypothetical protein